MTEKNSSTIGRYKKRICSNGDVTPDIEHSDATGVALPRSDSSVSHAIDTYQCIFTVVATGECVVFECADPDQLAMSLRGTVRKLNKAMVNASNSRVDEFCIVMQAKNMQKNLDKKLSDADVRIWDYIICDIHFGNEIKSTQVEIAEATGKSISTVNRSFKRFRELGLIVAGRSIRGTISYKISDKYVTKGIRELEGTESMANVIYGKFKEKTA